LTIEISRFRFSAEHHFTPHYEHLSLTRFSREAVSFSLKLPLLTFFVPEAPPIDRTSGAFNLMHEISLASNDQLTRALISISLHIALSKFL
jgi:hypothetical protein